MTRLELPTRGRIKRSTARVVIRSRLLKRLASSVGQLVGAPTTYELTQAALVFASEGRTAAEALLPGAGTYASEFVDVRNEIRHRSSTDRAFSPDVVVGEGTSEWLYCIVRALRPTTVVEVGVADGHSTAVILAGLDANGHGHLISADTSPDAGGMVGSHPRWTLRIHQPLTASEQLIELLEELGEIDLFFHDAGHSYLEQSDDYAAGMLHLRRDGVFLSDDVDFSWAFLELCRRLSLRPVVLGEGRKEAGGFVKSWSEGTGPRGSHLS